MCSDQDSFLCDTVLSCENCFDVRVDVSGSSCVHHDKVICGDIREVRMSERKSVDRRKKQAGLFGS